MPLFPRPDLCPMPMLYKRSWTKRRPDLCCILSFSLPSPRVSSQGSGLLRGPQHEEDHLDGPPRLHALLEHECGIFRRRSIIVGRGHDG